MNAHQAKILHITIAIPFADAYAFAHKPENFPKWAAGLSSSLHKTVHGWEADTPEGKATVRFSEPNNYGVLDHRISMAGKPDVYIPLRMLENGDETEVELVLYRQPGMDDADFDKDAGLVQRDLQSLKTLLEKEPTA